MAWLSRSLPLHPAFAVILYACILAPCSIGVEANLRQHHLTPLPASCAPNAALLPGTRVVRVGDFNITPYLKNDIVSGQVIGSHSWETSDVRQILWAMEQQPAGSSTENSEKLFVDVGANIGWFSLSVAAKGYRVAAFEAMDANVRLIQQALCLNSPSIRESIKLFNVALGSRAEACYVFSGNNNVGDGVTLCGAGDQAAALARVPQGYTLRSTTRVRRLDRILNEDVQVKSLHPIQARFSSVVSSPIQVSEDVQVKSIAFAPPLRGLEIVHSDGQQL